MLGFDKDSLADAEAPTRQELLYAVAALVIPLIAIPIEIDRLLNGFESGRMPWNMFGWFADYANSQVGFVLALAMHVGMIVLFAAFIWYGCLTIRLWFFHR